MDAKNEEEMYQDGEKENERNRTGRGGTMKALRQGMNFASPGEA